MNRYTVEANGSKQCRRREKTRRNNKERHKKSYKQNEPKRTIVRLALTLDIQHFAPIAMIPSDHTANNVHEKYSRVIFLLFLSLFRTLLLTLSPYIALIRLLLPFLAARCCWCSCYCYYCAANIIPLYAYFEPLFLVLIFSYIFFSASLFVGISMACGSSFLLFLFVP